MRVAISGTHGIGKTTALSWISERYGMPIIQERARELLLSGFFPFEKVQQDLSLFKSFQANIVQSQLLMEKNSGPSWVVDRTFVDSLVYVRERMAREKDTRENKSYLARYEKFVADQMDDDPYDVVLFIRNFDGETEADERNPNFFYRDVIDRLIAYEYFLLAKRGLNVAWITASDRQERQRQIAQALEGFL